MLRKSAECRFPTLAKSAVVAITLFVSACGELVSRDEFAGRVKDASESQVRKQAGKPTWIDDGTPGRVRWIYTARTFNIDDGNKFDKRAIVIFVPTGPEGALRVGDVQFE